MRTDLLKKRADNEFLVADEQADRARPTFWYISVPRMAMDQRTHLGPGVVAVLPQIVCAMSPFRVAFRSPLRESCLTVVLSVVGVALVHPAAPVSL